MMQDKNLRMASPARGTPASFIHYSENTHKNNCKYTTLPTRHTQLTHIKKIPHIQVSTIIGHKWYTYFFILMLNSDSWYYSDPLLSLNQR